MIVTDEVRTYAIFNYEWMGWTTHTEAGGDTTEGQVSWDGGDTVPSIYLYYYIIYAMLLLGRGPGLRGLQRGQRDEGVRVPAVLPDHADQGPAQHRRR